MNDRLTSASPPAMTIDTMLDKLATLTDRPLGTVVHLGAGNGMVLERYAHLMPDRVVLVEGDPDIGAALQRSAAGLPWAEVVDRPVAARAGPMAWHRYSLPTVNGPLDATSLVVYYPRLMRTASRTLDALAVADLLGGLGLFGDDPKAHVLVLDVPGQEDALLASLPEDLLRSFELVVLRGCREPLLPDGTVAGQAIARMQQACFDLVAPAGEQAPLWPVAHLRFNPQRFQLQQLELKSLEPTPSVVNASMAMAGNHPCCSARGTTMPMAGSEPPSSVSLPAPWSTVLQVWPPHNARTSTTSETRYRATTSGTLVRAVSTPA